MKILFVARSLTWGGAERQLTNLACHLAQRGHAVSVVLFYPGGELETELARAGVPVHHLEKRGRWDLLGPLRRLVNLVRREAPDVLHGYLPTANLLAIMAARLAGGVRLVLGVRASDMHLGLYDPVNFWTYKAEAFLSRFADLVIANSAAGLAAAWRRGFPRGRGIVIHNGVDGVRFHPDEDARQELRDQLHIVHEVLLIGMVARRDPMKDHECFLKAAASIARERADVEFLLAGRGVDAGDPVLAQLVAQVGAPVHLLGSRSDIERVIAALDLSVLASRFGEGFPNVVAEAMAAGVPTVATDVGDAALVVGNRSLVVPRDDPTRLARTCLELLPIARDLNLRQDCRARVVSRFSLEALADRTETVLDALSRPLLVHLITDLEAGGAEAVLSRLVVRSSRFRHVVVTLMGDGAFGRDLRSAGIEVIGLGMERGRISVTACLRLLLLLVRLRPVVVQTWLYHADVIGLIAARLAGIRTVIWNLRCSNMDLCRYGRSTRWVLAAARRLSSLPALVIANSDAGRRFHEGLGYHPNAWEIIRNGVDTERFRPDPRTRQRWRERFGVGGDVVLIGMVARRDPMKNHEGFLEAAAKVSASARGIAFVLAGRGVVPEDPVLSELAAAISQPLHWIGECEDVAGLMVALDLLVMPSRFGEGTPNVVLEAMSAGVPCIVTDVGDAGACVADTGFVVPPDDAEALAASVRRLAADGNLRAMLGEKARKRIQSNYELRAMVDRYETTWSILREKA